MHYGWWIALSAMLSIFVSLGVGRFALGMLLPAMAANLGLSYPQMGWISTANFAGYLLGALWVRRLLPRYGARRLIFGAIMGMIATMVGISMASGFVSLLILYAGTGLGGGIALISALKLIRRWFTSRWRDRASGFLFAGAGLAIMLAGWTVPLINGAVGSESWRLGWAGLAVVCLPLAIFCRIMIRNRPFDVGLRPFGMDSQARKQALNSQAVKPAASRASLRFLIMRLGAIYGLFGMAYVIYATFIVTTLVRQHGMTETQAGYFWIWIGFFSLFSGPVLLVLSERLGLRAGMSLALLLQGSALALIAYGSGDAAVYLSIALFGLSLFGVPIIISAAATGYLPRNRTLSVIGAVAVLFALGQMSGPILAGVMADYSGSFTSAYLAAAALLALAIAITLSLPDPSE
jgi:MFS family permease